MVYTSENRKKKKKAASKASKENGDPRKPVANGKPKKPLPPPKPLLANPYKKEISIAREEDFMSDLLGDLEKAPRSPSPPANLKRKVQAASASGTGHYGAFRNVKTTPSSSAFATSSDPILEGSSSVLDTAPSSDGLFDIASRADTSSRSIKKPRISGAERELDNLFLDNSFDGGNDDYPPAMLDEEMEQPESKGKIVKKEENDDDDDMMVVKAVKKGNSTGVNKRQLVNSASTKATKPVVKAEEEEIDVKDIKPVTTLQEANKKKSKGMDWQLAAAAVTLEGDVAEDDAIMQEESDIFSESASSSRKTKKLKAPSAGGGSLQTSKVQALEEDGSVRFYWLDYVETNGVLHFIGKVFDKESKKYVSCALTVEGIDRNLFVLPRQGGVDGRFSPKSPRFHKLTEDLHLT